MVAINNKTTSALVQVNNNLEVKEGWLIISKLNIAITTAVLFCAIQTLNILDKKTEISELTVNSNNNELNNQIHQDSNYSLAWEKLIEWSLKTGDSIGYTNIYENSIVLTTTLKY